MNDFTIRPAEKPDCAEIATLYSISSDGVANYIWTKLAEPDEDVYDFGRRRYEREGTNFSYENCTVVECDGKVVGMLVAFPMHIDPNEEPEADPVLAPYMELEEDNSYYICGVALLPDFRGKGFGKQLMALAEKQAKEKGFEKMSLVVFAENVGAKKLYQKLGYIEVKRTKIYPHPLIHFTGDALLMVKQF